VPNIGPMELIVVLIIALVVLGPKKLPEVGRSVGRGMREFKSSLTGDHAEPAPEIPAAVEPVAGPVAAPVAAPVTDPRR
jgi:sec-independent protein translocase protein TatA